MSAEVIGFIWVGSGAVALIAMVLVMERLNTHHNEVYEDLGRPGRHNPVEFHVIIDFFIFMVKRRYRAQNDERLSILGDVFVISMGISLVASVIMLLGRQSQT